MFSGKIKRCIKNLNSNARKLKLHRERNNIVKHTCQFPTNGPRPVFTDLNFVGSSSGLKSFKKIREWLNHLKKILSFIF